jgi:enoyl-CoA hydratase/carnithine racemase
MSAGCVKVERNGTVATIRISNPTKFNAMSLSMWLALHEAVTGLDALPEVRVIVLTGEGPRAFVSGADISGFAGDRTDGTSAQRYDAAVLAAQTALSDGSKPTVAAIQGVCMGGGIGLALACDLRYATDDARFRMPAARLGLGYALPAMAQVVDTLGAARALDLFLTARTFEGAEARRIGLVHDAFAADRFEREIDQRVRELAGHAPLTLRAAKAAIRECVHPTGAEGRARVDASVRACFDSADYREGQLAFRQRRVPKFVGA